jgi:hypothetical protein
MISSKKTKGIVMWDEKRVNEHERAKEATQWKSKMM